MSASTCAACDIIPSIKASHSRIRMVRLGDDCPVLFCFAVASKEYRREADLAMGSIHGKNQDISLGFGMDKIET